MKTVILSDAQACSIRKEGIIIQEGREQFKGRGAVWFHVYGSTAKTAGNVNALGESR